MDDEDKTHKKFVSIRDYKLKELADVYRVSKYLMKKRIKTIEKQLGKRKGYYFSFEQVKQIFRLIKLPSDITVIE